MRIARWWYAARDVCHIRLFRLSVHIMLLVRLTSDHRPLSCTLLDKSARASLDRIKLAVLEPRDCSFVIRSEQATAISFGIGHAIAQVLTLQMQGSAGELSTPAARALLLPETLKYRGVPQLHRSEAMPSSCPKGSRASLTLSSTCR